MNSEALLANVATSINYFYDAVLSASNTCAQCLDSFLDFYITFMVCCLAEIVSVSVLQTMVVASAFKPLDWKSWLMLLCF